MLSPRSRSALAATLLAASAGAQVTIAPASLAFFDISSTGNVLGPAYDDTPLGFTSTIGNDLFPAGNIVVTTNGHIVSGSVPTNAYFTNGPITPATTGVDFGYGPFDYVVCPWWDDLTAAVAPSGTLYWQEVFGVLFIQYHGIRHFGFEGPTTMAITFQVQVIPKICGISRINLVYPDTLFGGPATVYDNAASATIGYVGGNTLPNAQWSHNTPGSVTSGVSLTITTSSMDVAWTSPVAGSLQINMCGGSPLGHYQLFATTNVVAFPNGWFFGLDLTYPELFSELSAPPFFGMLDSNGAAVIGPIFNLPPGLTIYSLVFDVPPGGLPSEHTPPFAYTIP